MKNLASILILCGVLSTVAPADVLREIWSDVTTNTIDDAIAVVNGEVGPDLVDTLAQAGWTDRADSYVGKLSGILRIPADGDYTFYISGDDHNVLYVSQDTDEANAVQVAFVDGWTNWLEWEVSDTQRSEPMALTEGQLMAVYAVMREGGGGDNVSVGWTGPGIDGIQIIDGAFFRPTLAAVSQASAPAPANGAVAVEEATLSWSAPWDIEASTYTVYAGTDPAALDLVAEGVTGTSINLGKLGADVAYETTYYWRVDVGDVVGDTWSATTQTGKPIITAVIDDVVAPGGNAQLAIEVTSLDDSEMSFQWYRDKVVMMGFELFDVPLPAGITPVLDIPAATADDEGNYYCTVTNAQGETTSPFIILDVQTGLIHRYSFTEDATDSISDADGILVNNTGNATFADGQLVLGNDGSQASANDDGDFVDLPNGLVSGLSQMTIECWTTWTAGDEEKVWQRLFDIGTSSGGEGLSSGGGSTTALFFCPKNGGGFVQCEYRNLGAQKNVPLVSGIAPVGEPFLVTWAHDDLAGTVKVYINGTVVGGMTTNVTLKEFDDNNVWLGRSQWNDPLYVGSINEFRVYDTALSAEEIIENYLAGPDELGQLPEPCGLDIVGDQNGDCFVDFLDAAIAADQFLTQILEAELAQEEE